MFKQYDFVLLTESRYEQPEQVDWYVKNILTEDGLVQAALEKRGMHCARVDWNRRDFDFSRARACLFRTTWDYFNHYDQFQEWLKVVQGQTTLYNSARLVQWNMDKHYLQDLRKKGVRIPPTYFIEPGDSRSLKDIHQERGWSRTVLKPAVSGAGRHTYRLDYETIPQLEETYRALIQAESMLLQPFQDDVVTSGELALMVIDGSVTHAVRKVAKAGDFRVQDDFGGTLEPHDPTPEEIAFAENAFAACPETPIYGRVDIIQDNDGELALAELELIEPEMWFREHRAAADRLAEALVRHQGA